jgi:outer membrane protein assembly factor BamC
MLVIGTISASFMLVLSGCATDPVTEYNTPVARSSDTLVVPPGLSSPELNTDYKMTNSKGVDGKVGNSGARVGQDGGYLIDQVKDMHIMQGGSERWLVINNKTVDQVWPMIIAYLAQQGLMVKYKNQAVGLIQTDWANKNNTVHETGVRSLFDWIGWGSMYSMQSQYMFRINLWQNGNDTHIFVTDYQMNEVYPGCVPAKNSTVESSDHQTTRWMPVPPNPQLELDFLLHFMLYSGINPAEVKDEAVKVVMVTTNSSTLAAHLSGGTLVIDDGFDRAWWRTGLALERIGLGIADKNRTTGEYYVYPLQSQVDNPEPGFLSRWLGSSKNDLKLPQAQYNVKLVTKDSTHTSLTMVVTKQNTDKKPAEAIQKYLTDLLRQLQ